MAAQLETPPSESAKAEGPRSTALCATLALLALSPIASTEEARQATPGHDSGNPSTESGTRRIGSPFSIAQRDGKAWLLKPDGEKFFSLGVCCVNRGASREEFNTNNRGYAAWQHYSTPSAWAEATVNRLKSWRFTTIGAWSDFQTLRQHPDKDVAFAPVLHIGSTAGAPWWDMWDPKIIDRMDQVAREQILALRDDPRVIGYYSDNEIGWWNAILLKM